MSLETILAEIDAATAAQLAELKCDTQAQIQAILDEARQEAAVRYEEARLAVVRPVAVTKAQRLYETRLAAEQATAVTRSQFIRKIQTQVQRHLAQLRNNPAYRSVLRGLIEEAVHSLGTEEIPQLIIDLRDQALVRCILGDLALDLPVQPGLNSWGGVLVQSGDGRITITNTLESRLERAMPYVQL